MASQAKGSVEVSAKTVEEAIQRGLSELGLTRDQVEIEVVNPGRGGVLGIGAEDAQVRVSALPVEPSVEMESPRVEAEGEPPVSQPEPLESEGDVAKVAAELLQGLLDRMKVRARVKARMGDDLAEEGEEPVLILDVTGDDLGILIGRRGETLRALQYMTRLMLSKKLERWEMVIVDVESYRVRRRRSLRQLAVRMAERVAFSQQRVVLEAMPAHERRIIHIALRDHSQVATTSIGEGDRRKVTIVPK
ncbi:MAG: Jag N-terminal domain-containing protein [Anaerolineales bacterium]|nr:MAG: Jag N-terminal domain-containing protein [Anaerolineales bacterium]